MREYLPIKPLIMNQQVIDRIKLRFEGNNKYFFDRVWSTPSDVYLTRVKAIGFEGKQNVLDAGFGMGQWLPALAALNKNVFGIEFDKERYEPVQELTGLLGLGNVHLDHGSIEQLPYADEQFDAIFSYSVILCVDYRKALMEFYRVLKPGGKLYFNTNGLGWYLHNLLEGHNHSEGFSSKQMAIDAFNSTIKYFSEGKTTPATCIITPKFTILKDLEGIGFRNTILDSEGHINVKKDLNPKPFFKGEYCNEEGVFEVLTQK